MSRWTVRVLDGFRGVGAVLVLATHSLTAADGISPDLWVRMLTAAATLFALGFFALSAYLLFYPMVLAILSDGPIEAPKSFYRRRFRRVAPAAWLAIVVYVTVVPNVVLPESSIEWVSVFGFAQQWRTDWIILAVPPMWTLCNEVVFYFALPHIGRVLKRSCSGRPPQDRFRFLVVSVLPFGIVALMFRAYFAFGARGIFANEMGKWPFSFMDFFVSGICIAAIAGARKADVLPPVIRRFADWPAWKWWSVTGGTWWLVVASHQSIIRGVSYGWLEMTWLTLLTVGSFSLVASMTLPPSAGPLVDRILGNSAVRWIGSVSFGMYLWHWAVILVLDDRWPALHAQPGWIRMLLIGSLSVGLGAISWYFVEKPAMASRTAAHKTGMTA